MCKSNLKFGFTLIEIIISMLIFAVISLMSYGALHTYSTHQKLAFGHLDKINNLQKTTLFVQRDLSQVFNQEIRLTKNILVLKSWQNDQILNIRYTLKGGNLVREEGDSAHNMMDLTLITGIKKYQIRLLNDKNKWLTKRTQKASHIKALELSFESDYWGKVKQLVMIGE